jgi:DNA-binding NtrC family response regulator
MIHLAASCDVAVLITGETGTGKSTLAKAIHQQSRRKVRPWVTINLASAHEGTLESDLFGHERGAFTGADQRRIGKFELANGGTVFLDEVGELTLRLQARLLEVLQSQTIIPVGSNREIKLDVRVIAATHRNLEQMVSQGSFREDLLHRLRVLAVETPSLRDQSADFDQIVHSNLSELSCYHQRTIHKLDEAVAHIFENYRWPGNYRELRNVLEFAVLTATSPQIRVANLPRWFLRAVAGQTELPVRGAVLKIAEIPLTLNFAETLERFEREYLTHALLLHGGRVNQTARKIGTNKTTLLRKIKHLGIDRGLLGAG